MPPKAPKSAERKPEKKGAPAQAANALSHAVTIRVQVTAVAKQKTEGVPPEEPETTTAEPEVTWRVHAGLDFFCSSAAPERKPLATSEEMPAINSLGGLPFEWTDEQEVLVDEKMVRELVGKKGLTALTLRFHNLLEGETSDTECALALDCAPLLLGETVIHATWPSNADRNLLLEEHYESIHARLEVKQPSWDEPQQAGEVTETAHPPQQKLVPHELSKKLAPVLVTPDKVASLPDLPATQDSLSNSCHPVFVWYKFVGDDVTAHIHNGTPSLWQDSTLEGLPATRDVHFGQSDIILAGDYAPGELRTLCDRGVLEVRVYDRSALPEEEVKLYVPRPSRQTVAGGDGQAPAGNKPPAKGGKTAALDQDTQSELSEPATEPECPVYGLATFSLHRLAAGDVDVKLKANIVPVTQLKGGAELDWKSRPGKYVESAAYMVLRVRSAQPLSRQEVEVNPYARVIFLTEYKDSDLYVKLRLLVRKTNIQALNLQGTETHVLTTLTTYKLEPEQQQDPNVDLLTGFQLVDGKRRLMIIEGLANGAMREVAAIAQQAAAALPAGSKTTILYNEALKYPTRLYGWLGVDLWPLKLCKPLPDLLAIAGNMTGNRLRPECMEALKRLNKLIEQSWMREVDRMQLFPLYPMLNALDKRFAGELTVEDLEGKPLAVRVRKAILRAGDDDQKEAGDINASVEDSKGNATRSRGALKAALDMDNSTYLTTLQRQREARLERDFHYEYMESLPQLYESSGQTKKNEFLTSNPQRTWERMEPETIDMQRMQRRVAAQNQLEPPAGHHRNFQYPFPTQPHEYMQLQNKPSGARIEELQQAWVENENFRPDVESDTSANRFNTVFRGAREGGTLFDQSLEHYESVFAVPEELAMEEEFDRFVKELESWRSKVVVDDLCFHSTFVSRKKPGQIDKHQLMLHGPRKKKGISGRSKLEPSIQSIHLSVPWEGAGQWEDFRPKQTAVNRLQQTEPKDRPSAHLRKLEPERFTATKQHGGSHTPQDFNRFMPLAEPTAVHKRSHVDGPPRRPEQPPKVHLHHPLPLPPPPKTGPPPPGTPPLPFGHVSAP